MLQFPPSSNTETLYVSFDVILDDIYELDEGFFVIIEVDEEGSDLLAAQDVKIDRSVTLAIIGNDDGKLDRSKAEPCTKSTQDFYFRCH